MLLGICRELQEDDAVPEVALRELSELKALGKNLQMELYERTWKRLERLSADKLDLIEKVAALLACAPAELSEPTIRETLKLRRADWVNVQKQFAEYLVQSHRYPPFTDEPLEVISGSEREQNLKPVVVFRLFHQTLVEYVRHKLEADLSAANSILADYCHTQLGKPNATYEFAYALRFGPEHLRRAKRWEDLRQMLTDFDFIETNCKSGDVCNLVADFDLARQNDPGWLQAVENESRRRKVLEKWSANVIERGTRWSAELRRAWQHDDPESVEPERPFPFPDPPDTSDLCNLIRGEGWDKKWDARSWPDAISDLESWRAFLTESVETLTRHPKAFYQCVANSSMRGEVREQAETVLRDRNTPWLEEGPRVGLDAGIVPLPTIPVKATAFAISADGRRAATGEGRRATTLDLVTGKCLNRWESAHPVEVSHVFLSVDGSRLVSTSDRLAPEGDSLTPEFKRGLILVHECREFREVWFAKTDWDVVDLSCSPEGSVVAVACSDDAIRVFDVYGEFREYRDEASLTRLETIARVQIWPEQFCVLGFDGEWDRVCWNLITGENLGRLPPGMEDSRHELEADDSHDNSDGCPTLIGLGQFVCCNVKGRSANGRIAVDEYGIYIDCKYKCSFDEFPSYMRSREDDIVVIADGRVVWSRGEDAVRGADLLAYEENEEIEVRPLQRDRGRWERRFVLEMDWDLFNLFADEAEESEVGVTQLPLFARLVEEPPCDPERAVVTIKYTDRRAYTSDLRIAVNHDNVPEDDSGVLHRIDVPEGEVVELIQVSPCGQRAFISHTSGWFVWDIARGTKHASREHMTTGSYRLCCRTGNVSRRSKMGSW